MSGNLDYKAATSIYDFEANSIKGNIVPLSNYKGHVCLIVNVASKCGLTKTNYKELNELYDKYGESHELGKAIKGRRCGYYLAEKRIPTTKCVKEPGDKNKEFFKINYKMAFACLHAGIGNQGLNKLLASAGLPTMNYGTYKDYERRAGSVVEIIAKESCDKAAKIERQLTIENAEEIEKIV
ncbi:probable phospholipid hydroperoxide glutathione peroxidase isoform X1 [Diachasma alloeum]|uniref:probable phospholipid hydroperoxide glutathione peroxidase isoform X1 n=1 Tax=Diachasma alloeum TaxID=454923 RepID=UPI00073835A7|nr:probable phospholipid hydroperoxide glutathione peroxidase isoform X1 [Diachasma alloeum]